MMNSQNEALKWNRAERADLSDAIQDTTLSLHPLAELALYQHGLCAQMKVFDLSQVQVTPAAKSATKHAYLTELYLIEQYARHYVDALLRTVTRGKDKGLLVLDPKASTYVHCLRDGNELIVQGDTIEVNGAYTRRLTISCRNEQLHGGCNESQFNSTRNRRESNASSYSLPRWLQRPRTAS